MRRALRCIKTAFKCVLAALVAVLAAYNVYILVQRYAFGNGMPTVFGYANAVVVSGSMEPEIMIGDVVVVKSQSAYDVGDVITFYDSSMGEYVTHRIIMVSQSGLYATKGDANNAEDKFSVPQGAVVGKVVYVAHGAGSVITFFQSPAGLLVLIGVAVVFWILTDVLSMLSEKGRKEEKNEREEKE